MCDDNEKTEAFEKFLATCSNQELVRLGNLAIWLDDRLTIKLIGNEIKLRKDANPDYRRVIKVVMNDKEIKKLDKDFAKAKKAILGIFHRMKLGYATCFGILGSFLSNLLEEMLRGSPEKVEILEEFLEDFIRQLRLSWQKSKDKYKK